MRPRFKKIAVQGFHSLASCTLIVRVVYWPETYLRNLISCVSFALQAHARSLLEALSDEGVLAWDFASLSQAHTSSLRPHTLVA